MAERRTLARIGTDRKELLRAVEVGMEFYRKHGAFDVAHIVSTTFRPARPGLRIDAEVEFR